MAHAHKFGAAQRPALLEALSANGMLLQDASDRVRADRELVLAAVRSRHEAMECAATARDICVLRFASEELRRDREVVVAALEGLKRRCTEQHTTCSSDSLLRLLRDASPTLLGDREFALAAVEVEPKVRRELLWLTPQLRAELGGDASDEDPIWRSSRPLPARVDLLDESDDGGSS